MAEQPDVGREVEQARFAALLQELSEAGGSRRTRWSARRPADVDAPTSRSRVVLIDGPGGSGKTRLLRQFRAMAEAKARTAWLDWARVAAWDSDPSAGAGATAGAAELGIVTVLGAVQWAITRAFADEDELATGRLAHEFREYRNGADRMAEYVARVSEVVQRAGRPGFPCSRSDAATLMRKVTSAGLAIFVGPRDPEGQGSDDLAEAAGPPSAGPLSAGPLSAVIAQAVTKRAPDELPPQEYALVTDPAMELTRRFAVAVSALAVRKPLVVFLDDGELISDLAWQWLRLVMARTGNRVAWVVAGRFAGDAKDGDDSQPARFAGDLFATDFGDRLTLISPAPFDDSMISAYLRGRPRPRECAREEIELITRCTAGLPLAVSLTATLLDDGATVAQACEVTGESSPGSATARLIRRLVLDAEADRGDAARILALALAYGRPGDSDLLAALWGDSYPMEVFEELASRHDFLVLPSLRLHDQVRNALRKELLNPDWRPLARRASERARTQSLARLKSARDRWPTLDQQLDQSEFTAALLRAIWFSTWISNQDGLDLLTAAIPVLMAANPRVAGMALNIMRHFAVTFTPEEKRHLEQLTQQPPDPSGDSDGGALIGQPGDRQAAAHILRARHHAAHDRHEEAVASLQRATASTTSDLLRNAIGGLALAITGELLRAGPGGHAVHSDTSLAAAELAAGLVPGNVIAWWRYGPALDHAGRVEEALAAHYKALEFHPDDAATHSNIGVTLRLMGRFTEALAANDRALAIAPDNVHFCSNRVAELCDVGRFAEALTAADEAVILDPSHSPTYLNRGVVLAATGKYTDALAAFEHAIALDQDNAAAHANKGIALAATGELDKALAEFDLACRLDPPGSGRSSAWAGAIMWHRGDDAAARQHFARVADCLARHTAYQRAELEAIARCALGEPDSGAERLLGALSLRSAADRCRTRAIYDLLADPPLPGIDRLRAIIDKPPSDPQAQP